MRVFVSSTVIVPDCPLWVKSREVTAREFGF
jgi:hypothetical protein